MWLRSSVARLLHVLTIHYACKQAKDMPSVITNPFSTKLSCSNYRSDNAHTGICRNGIVSHCEKTALPAAQIGV